MTAPAPTGIHDLDARILDQLRLDGRIGRNELSAKLGVSRPTVAKRLNALLESGHTHVVGIVHPATVGLEALAHVSISVEQPVRQVAARVATLPEVPYVSLISGRYPLIAEIRTHAATDLAAVLDRLRSIDGVRDTNTLYYSDLMIDAGQPQKVAAAGLDALDMRLLAQLQEDGRASYAVLAAAAGTTAGTARMRVMRLIDEGIVRISALSTPGQGDAEVAVGFGVRASGRVSGLSPLIAELPGVRFLAATIGRFDLLGTIYAPRLDEVVAALDRLRALRPVLEVDNWVHLDLMKEHYGAPMR
ncbi:Lrp/AsnC family transcriptional regulator [Nocardia sp. alder85J]|uniref:Lrp/AsnC family transcriptional regulator n=1 Tax=Nocardia sp. alder85J TaxID=2862949 RepID=UPI001CD4BA0E|nr:Lrp/AsnC family transcriptional regulator [Nocardia sp. alder85J]MCX4097028.1 Lrp/AsnC family transcriptional regulator [Nocardia sp. alder85J]